MSTVRYSSLLAWLFSLAFPLILIPIVPGPSVSAPPPVIGRVRTQPGRLAPVESKLAGQVRDSITAGVKYLVALQEPNGSWEFGAHQRSNPGGWTALVLLALLTAGESPDSPVVKRGLEYLRAIPPRQTYVVGLQTMVLAQARQAGDRPRLEANVRWLLDSRLPDGWTYGKLEGRGSGSADNSNTQYALLGLHEAILAGVRVPEKDLEAIQKFYLSSQRDGGWSYRQSQSGNTMTMTCAGLCNLVITGMDLARGKARLRPDGSAENCGVYADNVPVTRALELIGARFPGRLTVNEADTAFGSPFYGLYGIERVGRLTGQRFLGGHDWYEVGCRFLVDIQKPDGHWEGMGGRNQLDGWPVVATSFALLFLAKGRTPVLVSKLAYGAADEQGWNNKRNDVRHVVEFTSRELFKNQPLAWQVFDVRRKEANTLEERRALAAELLGSPIVYFNGHDMAPRNKEEEILREYVDNGGFILAENCCGRTRYPGFDSDFRRLVRQLFPDNELQPLEPEHPVWLASGKFAISPRDFPLEGVKRGCRTVLIYSPVPLAGYWEANQQDTPEGRKAFQLAANIIAYATGLEAPQPRLTRHRIVGDDRPEKIKRGFLKVAQLKHEGDWQPAPRAMRTLMTQARAEGLDVMLQTDGVSPNSRKLMDYRFFYLHGRKEFREKPEDLKNLRFLLKSGGTLLADACCGSRAFDRSFREFVQVLFAEDKLKLEPILATDELFGAELNGEAIERVNRRQLGAGGRVERSYQSVRPALEGVKYKGRWIVIYSQYDIGCALESHTSPDCLGHDHASALRLARAALLYAVKR
jgi:hypothetical protein